MIEREHLFPVAEIFGPTLQGEGVDQGRPAHFVRFGGCDYKCDWCDTPHAVLPAEVRHNERLSSFEIAGRVFRLGRVPWVIITGGNPALHDLRWVVLELQEMGFKVAVETQGSRWNDWLKSVDRLCISPKPPSAKMKVDWNAVEKFYGAAMTHRDLRGLPDDWMFSKVVIFDRDDLEWVKKTVHFDCPLYLSAGNDAGRTVGNPERIDTRAPDDVRLDLLERSLWLTEEVLRTPALHHAVVQSQYHVLLWGNELGH